MSYSIKNVDGVLRVFNDNLLMDMYIRRDEKNKIIEMFEKCYDDDFGMVMKRISKIPIDYPIDTLLLIYDAYKRGCSDRCR